MNTGSENLDPLRQKPDFEEYANEHAGTHSASTQIAVGIKQGCEHVWTSHVEPLMKELEAVRDHFDDTGEDYRMCLSVLKHCGELRIKAESRIRELEEDRDKFAIGFAEWMMQNRWYNTSTNQDGVTLYYQHYTLVSRVSKTIPELLQLYKESLLNQRP